MCDISGQSEGLDIFVYMAELRAGAWDRRISLQGRIRDNPLLSAVCHPQSE